MDTNALSVVGVTRRDVVFLDDNGEVIKYGFLRMHPISSKMNLNQKDKTKGHLMALKHVTDFRGDEFGPNLLLLCD